MNIDQFLTNLDTFGADLYQWPNVQARQEAETFLLVSPEARQALESAQLLAALFVQDREHKAPEHVVAAIKQISQYPVNLDSHDEAHANVAKNRPSYSKFSDRWPTAIAAAIPLIISFAAGVGVGLQPAEVAESATEYPDYAEINSWVYADSLNQNTIEFSAFFPAAEEGLDNDAT